MAAPSPSGRHQTGQRLRPAEWSRSRSGLPRTSGPPCHPATTKISTSAAASLISTRGANGRCADVERRLVHRTARSPWAHRDRDWARLQRRSLRHSAHARFRVGFLPGRQQTSLTEHQAQDAFRLGVIAIRQRTAYGRSSKCSRMPPVLLGCTKPISPAREPGRPVLSITEIPAASSPRSTAFMSGVFMAT